MATLVSDDFNRANSTTVVGNPQVGPAPIVLAGTLGINANMLYAPVLASSQAIVAWDVGSTEVDVVATVAAIANSARTSAVVLGAASVDEFYLWQVDNATATLYQRNPGGLMAIASAPLPVAPGAETIVRASHRNGIVSCYYEGVAIFEVEVPKPIASTRHGLRLTNVSTTNGKADALLIRDAPPAPAPGTGAAAPVAAQAATFLLPDGFTYLGRDSKAEDIAGGS